MKYNTSSFDYLLNFNVCLTAVGYEIFARQCTEAATGKNLTLFGNDSNRNVPIYMTHDWLGVWFQGNLLGRATIHPGDSWEWPKYSSYQSENCRK